MYTLQKFTGQILNFYKREFRSMNVYILFACLVLCFFKGSVYPDDQIQENEMGGASLVNGGKEKCMQGFCGGNMKERDHLKDQE